MYNIVLWQEGNQRVAKVLQNNISSFGDSYEEALESIQEAIDLYEEDNESMAYPISYDISNLRFASMPSSRYA